jgi:flagellar biosynthesis/type III secretory pathway protein FliH
MARVFKSGHALRKEILSFERHDLEAPQDPLEEESGGSYSHDPEAIRQAILDEAKAEAARKVQEAYDEGFRRGEAAGQAAFEAQVNHAGEMLQDAALRLVEAREAFLESLEPQVLETIALIAQRVLEREMRTDSRLVLSVARRALTQIVDREVIRLKVHPADYDALKNYRITLLEDFESIRKLEIECDDAVTPGGCVAESGLMHIDARLETLLSHILEAFQE